MHIRNLCLVFVLFLVTIPAMTSAQSVVVLGINSMEGDDDATRRFTTSLRGALADHGCSVDARDASLGQMQVVNNCDSVDIDCLVRIADSLSTGAIVFGTTHRVNTDTSLELELELHYFDLLERRIIAHHTVRFGFEPSDEAIAAMTLVAAPALTDYVRAPEPARGDPLPPSTPSNNEWLGWSLIGLGVALVLADIPVWVRVNDLNNDPGYRAYRMSLPMVANACTSEAPGNVRSICDEGTALEILQFVFLGLGVASAATGALLLATGVLVSPSVSTDRATLTVSGTF